MKFNLICFLLLVSIFFFSCGDENDTATPKINYSYFPSGIGHEIIYDVDSISKNDFTLKTDTFHFQVKEIIQSAFTDNEGRPTLRIERYKRPDGSQPWVMHKVWSANLTSTAAEKKEDNITYIKLIFPVTLSKEWNGNAKNDMDEQKYKYTSANLQEKFNNFTFDSALTVLQNDLDDGFTKKKYEVEKYASGAGMFYKEYFTGNYKYPPDTADPFNSFISYKETAIKFNN